MSLVVPLLLFNGIESFAAYNHFGDIDSANFRAVYPEQVGTKLDSCTLCHSGGSYISGGKTTTLGSCQWCHYKTDYGKYSTPENLTATLNQYGKDYLSSGRNTAGLLAIGNKDSDGDGYSNQAEITALTFPGDKNDDPTKVPAPSIIFTREELEQMPQHTQFLMMNASKSNDTYVQYSGVALENLIKAIMLDSAQNITVTSPDGYSLTHPFTPSSNINTYHVFGVYPPSVYYYNEQADLAKNPSTGWAEYNAPSCEGRTNGTAIYNPEGLKMLLAIKRDGQYLTPGVLNKENKLDGEGPFRVVPPQKNPGPPDQKSTATKATDPTVWVWPYISNADHNAGQSARTVTMIKVGPLPAGTTDINTYEAGWPYVDENKIVIYGSITSNLSGKLSEELDSLQAAIQSSNNNAFKNKSSKDALVNKIQALKKQVNAGAYSGVLEKLQNDILQKTDGCMSNGTVDNNDWVTDIVLQEQLCQAIQRIWILLVIVR